MSPLLLQPPSVGISKFTSNCASNVSNISNPLETTLTFCLVSAPPSGFRKAINKTRNLFGGFHCTTSSWRQNSFDNVVKKIANFDGKTPEFHDFRNCKSGSLYQKAFFASRGIRHRNLLVTAFGNKEDAKPTVQREAEEALSIDKEIFYKKPSFWFQVFVAVMTLGFIDAGYSGDWSRIGVLSVEQENLLKTAAFFVVPVSVGLIWKLSK